MSEKKTEDLWLTRENPATHTTWLLLHVFGPSTQVKVFLNRQRREREYRS